MNKIVLITIIFLIIPTVYAALCENRIDADTECLILTPVIDCNTSATILSNNGGLETKTMISVGNGIYNFTFKNVTGSYTIILCDNTTSQISVKETVDGKLDDLEVNVTKILSDIEDNQSQWITATGFATLQNTSDIRNDIGKLEDNLSDVADNVTEILVNLKDNQSQWITATGFETEGNASNRFTQVQENLSYIKSNLTTIISEVDFLEENVTTVLNLLRDATYGLEAIKNYLKNTKRKILM